MSIPRSDGAWLTETLWQTAVSACRCRPSSGFTSHFALKEALLHAPRRKLSTLEVV